MNAFQPLPDFYLDNTQKYGWPFEVEEAETCNLGTYARRVWRVIAIDWYALYLNEYLLSLKSNSAVKIWEAIFSFVKVNRRMRGVM